MTEIILDGVIGEDLILELETSQIQGKLNHFIIDVNEVVNVEIVGREHPDIIFFKHPSLIRKHYLPIRLRPINNEGEGYTHGAFVKYKINDRLLVLVRGKEETKFKIWIDFDEVQDG